MGAENLAYALTQLVHNFGAVTVTAGPVAALALAPGRSARGVAALVALAWMLQIVSGAGFGAVSFYAYGRFPDLGTIALLALSVKVASAAGGLTLAVVYVARTDRWAAATRQRAWRALAALGATALGAAAFLRWFS